MIGLGRRGTDERMMMEGRADSWNSLGIASCCTRFRVLTFSIFIILFTTRYARLFSLLRDRPPFESPYALLLRFPRFTALHCVTLIVVLVPFLRSMNPSLATPCHRSRPSSALHASSVPRIPRIPSFPLSSTPPPLDAPRPDD